MRRCSRVQQTAGFLVKTMLIFNEIRMSECEAQFIDKAESGARMLLTGPEFFTEFPQAPRPKRMKRMWGGRAKWMWGRAY